MELTDLPAEGVPLTQILGQYEDEPLPDLRAYDRLAADVHDVQVIRDLCDWVEAQTTCDRIVKFHGYAGLKRVLQGIARAAAKLGVQPLPSRIRSVAGALG